MVFLVHAFTIPLGCILLMRHVPRCSEGTIQLILFGIEGASPAIAAILSALNKDGGKGLKNFLHAKYVEGFNIKIAILGFLLPALLLTIAKLLTYITPYHNQFLTIPNTKKIIILLWALVAEELGWRGYLQKEIDDKLGAKIAPLLIGIIWGAWHYHFFLPASLWHFSGNLFFNLYLLNPNWNEGSLVPYIIINSLMTVFIIVFYISDAKKNKGGKSL